MEIQQSHQPVLLNEVLDGLSIEENGLYIDGTFGRGGHAQAILKRLGESGRLMVMDKDPSAIAEAQRLFADDARVIIHRASFTEMKALTLTSAWYSKVSGILLDLGVSSPQLDEAQRGFSFKLDGVLDMRMDPHAGPTAAEWIAKVKASELAKVLKEFGEERFAKRIANAIVRERQQQPIVTTRQLAAIIAQAQPRHDSGKDPATRSFQAIRIFINRELESLQSVLPDTLEILKPGGRLAVISFHSLEDRIVKRFMRKQAKGDDYPLDLPVTTRQLNPVVNIIGRVQHASPQEIERNPRARSAVLRIAEKRSPSQ